MIEDNEWVVIFGNGYDSVSGEAVLYILNVNGTVIRKYIQVLQDAMGYQRLRLWI